MRETLSDDTQKLWVFSTNKPYDIIAICWIINGYLFIIIGIQYFFFFPRLFSTLMPFIFSVVFGIFLIIGAVFLFYDSKSIHNEPFPQKSACKFHPDQLAYDWCAICGTLVCSQDLVRIKQKFWGVSPGMFGFDGVACQDCAQRRVVRYFMISLILFLILFPLLIFLGTSLIISGPVHLAGVLSFIFEGVVFGLICVTGWFWWKVWRIVTTPLSQQPERMIPTTTRLVKREIGDGKTVFKKRYYSSR